MLIHRSRITPTNATSGPITDLRRGRGAVAIGATTFALCLVSFALAAPADAYVYWTSKQTIGRANLDGSGVDQTFIPTAAYGLTVDANHIYWANSSAGRIDRANLDGNGVDSDFITPGSFLFPTVIAVDADHAYWATSYLSPSIGRANLDGTGVNQNFIPQNFIPTTATIPDVAVDANHFYWEYVVYSAQTERYSGTIGRANLDGTGADPTFIDAGEHTDGLAVDANHLYWTNYNELGPGMNSPATIGRANLDGTGVDPAFISDAGLEANDVAVDSGHVYWSLPGSIGRANLDGTGVDQSFISGLLEPSEIAVDALPPPSPPDADPPNTGFTKGAPDETRKTKLEIEFISSEPNSTFECKLDKKPYAACASPREVKRLKDGKHKFKVRAIDAAGNVDPSPAKDKFRVRG